jgi:membrane protein involved in colicin uptake
VADIRIFFVSPFPLVEESYPKVVNSPSRIAALQAAKAAKMAKLAEAKAAADAKAAAEAKLAAEKAAPQPPAPVAAAPAPATAAAPASAPATAAIPAYSTRSQTSRSSLSCRCTGGTNRRSPTRTEGGRSQRST